MEFLKYPILSELDSNPNPNPNPILSELDYVSRDEVNNWKVLLLSAAPSMLHQNEIWKKCSPEVAANGS